MKCDQFLPKFRRISGHTGGLVILDDLIDDHLSVLITSPPVHRNRKKLTHRSGDSGIFLSTFGRSPFYTGGHRCKVRKIHLYKVHLLHLYKVHSVFFRENFWKIPFYKVQSQNFSSNFFAIFVSVKEFKTFFHGIFFVNVDKEYPFN